MIIIKRIKWKIFFNKFPER